MPRSYWQHGLIRPDSDLAANLEAYDLFLEIMGQSTSTSEFVNDEEQIYLHPTTEFAKSVLEYLSKLGNVEFTDKGYLITAQGVERFYAYGTLNKY